MNERGPIDATLARAVESGSVVGLAAVAVDRDGVIYEGAFGRRSASASTPLAFDAMFRVASMTKGITSLAAMQLVEQGTLDLDGPIADVLPELHAIAVLEEDGTMRPPARPVTLRHLLTHTSGFGYPFTSARLARYVAEHPDVPAPPRTLLVFDPGDGWQYGVNTDWVGRMIEVASGLSLDTYFERYLLGPLGMTDTTFALSDEQLHRLAPMHRRAADGSYIEHPRGSLAPNLSGGGGLFSTAPDYARFMRLMLTDGAIDGQRLVGHAAMEALVAKQTGDLTAGRWLTADPSLSNDTDFSDDGTSSWSLGFLRAGRDVPGGRSEGSLAWGGIENTYYWIDRRAGLAGAFFTQILPFADPTSLGIFADFERALYASRRQ